MTTQTVDVRVWDIQKRKKATGVRYIVRWTVDGVERQSTFLYKAQADAHRTMLLSEARNGAAFDVATGLPVSSGRVSGPTCYEVAKELVAARWANAAANSRRSMVDNLAYVLPHLVQSGRKAPDELRLALRATLGRNEQDLTPAGKDALRWLERASLPITAVTDDTVRRVLDACATRPDGTVYSDTIRKQRRTYLSGLFAFARERKYVRENPVSMVKAVATGGTSGTVEQVTPEQIGDLHTARKAIEAVAGDMPRAFLTTMLLAGMRPSEVAALRIKDCQLPDIGWGTLNLSKSASAAGATWTDSGESRDDRQLKHRRKGAVRVVPIPPELVKVLRSIIGERTQGNVFETSRGIVSDTTIGRAWEAARVKAGLDAEVLPRAYDLRHLAASLWLNAGVPVVEVASRLGHSAEVCLKVYAHTIATERQRWNSVIEDALSA